VTALVEHPPAESPRLSRQVFCGWGRTAPSRASVARPSDGSVTSDLLRGLSGPVIARGLGRSYGDAAQCSGGLVVDTAGLCHIGAIDEETGAVEVGGGVSLHQLMQHIVPRGWFVAVTPGTRFVSVGGAIASDVHGKNHHCDGSFARHVLAMTLATPTGTFKITPDDDPELFWATAGGMGLTGIVETATLRLFRIETSFMRVESRRYSDLDELMAIMEQSDASHRYTVAWLDCLGRRDGKRRSVLSLGEHAAEGELPEALRSRALEVPGEPTLRVPRTVPARLANRVSVRLLNEGWFRAASMSRGALTRLSAFFHPLDGLGGWNLLYGPHGFVQYQFAVPPGRGDVIAGAVDMIASSGMPSFLAVLKRFGPGTPGPLSFSQEGWTLALDFPVGPTGLPLLLDRLDEMVAGARGRVYLAKDARLRPELLQTMYPRLAEFDSACRRVDPDGLFVSDLSRRLGIKQ
jgi:decaprenylphospho-beta-D-ribofuranose 2-oxidase